MLYVYVFTITVNIFLPYCMKFDIKKSFYLLYYNNIYIYIYQTGARQEAGNQTLIIRVEIIVVKYSILVPSWPHPSLLLLQYVLSDQSH